MKLGIKTFLIIFSISLIFAGLSITAMMHFQSIRIEQQISIVNSAINNIAAEHPNSHENKQALANKLTSQLRRGAKSNFIIVMVGVVLTILLCSTIAYLVVLSITSKLKLIAGTAELLKMGESQARIGFQRHDELGNLSIIFDEMADAIAERQEKITTANHQLQNEIEEKKHLAELHRESEERLKTIFDSVLAAIILIDKETRCIVNANPAAISMVGVDKETLIGSACCEYFCQNKNQECPVLDLGLKVDCAEKTVYRGDGSTMPVLKTVVNITLDGREHLLESMLDLTEVKNLQEQFLQAQKMETVGRLAGGVAHDFNNFLTAIIGYSQLAANTLDDKVTVLSYLQIIQQSGEKAAGVARQLLAFSRKQSIELQTLNLNTIIENLTKMLGRLIGEDIELKLNLAQQIIPIKADPVQIEQIIMNLVINARDAMPDGGQLLISTINVEIDKTHAASHINMKPGTYTMMSVADTGEGINQEIRSQIFEPFFTTKEKEKGTGLGLATVHNIVGQHDGCIYVESEPNQGTVFKIYFPATDESTGRPATSSISQIPEGNENILIVDDEATIRAFLKDCLEQLGYHCLQAKNGIDALEMCANLQQPVDLLLTDIIMPKMGGKELAAKFQTRWPKIKIIFISGYSDTTLDLNNDSSSKLNYLEKPISLSQLAFKVREALDQSS